MSTTAPNKRTAVHAAEKARKQSSKPSQEQVNAVTKSVVTAASVAKDNGLDPVAFRKYLRSEDLRDAERDAILNDKRKCAALLKRFAKVTAATAK